MKIIIAIAIAIVALLAGFYLYSGDNTAGPDAAPLVEGEPATPTEPVQPAN